MSLIFDFSENPELLWRDLYLQINIKEAPNNISKDEENWRQW
jgi:hypothetical protein